MGKHVLGGRAFRSIGESTIQHDYTFMGMVREAGLDRPTLEPGETPQDFAARLLGEILSSGRAFDLLGVLLIPEGMEDTDWTPELGEETAAHLAHLTEPDDKAKVNGLVLSTLIDFFQTGLASYLSLIQSSPAGGGTSPNQETETESGTGSTPGET